MAKDDDAIPIMIDDEKVLIDFLDFNGCEWHTIKKQMGGMKPSEVMDAASLNDFDAIAALAWAVLRRDDPSVQYDEILSGLSMRSLIDDEDDDEEDDERPSDSGADSEG